MGRKEGQRRQRFLRCSCSKLQLGSRLAQEFFDNFSMAGHVKELREMPMNHLIEQVLPFRSPGYLETFCEKLLAEGIASPQDLLGTTKAALETKLSTHASFNFIELADTISLRSAIDPEQKSADAQNRGSKRSPARRRSLERRYHRSRSPRRRSPERRWQRFRSSNNRQFRNDRGGERSDSRSHRSDTQKFYQ